VTIQITNRTAESVAISDGNKRYELPPLVAGNIHVVSPAAIAGSPDSLMRLSDLKPGDEAQVVLIDQELRGFTRRRLLDLGLTPNSRINAHLANAFGDPTAYRVRGTTIALRKDQASRIWVKKAAAEGEARVQ
jgi:DtxR family Mn-dependent transcriptional regulator